MLFRLRFAMNARVFALMALALCLHCAPLAAQSIGISNGVPYTVNPADTVSSPFLPSLPPGPAGQHGFLRKGSDGNLTFTDGTPARFYGVTLQWKACYPDSAEAIVVAARLRKLGVNLVRFQYMDNAYDWGPYGQERTFLDAASGFKTLNSVQIGKLDWFIHQLKQRGIYAYFFVQSARVARASDGLGADADSLMWIGKEANYLYPQARAVTRSVAGLLLNHVNPYTGLAYKNEPAIAMIEGADQGSLMTYSRLGYTEYRQGQGGFSWRHSRRLDTLWCDFLKRKYGNTQTLTAAWHVPVPNGGFPNKVQEGSFEGDFERYWNIDSYNGVTVTPILAQGDSIPNGTLALKLRVRNSPGAGGLYNAYMVQPVDSLEFNTLYRLTFRAKASVDKWLIRLGASQTSQAGMSAGLSQDIEVSNYWRTYSADFLVPIKSTVPIALVWWYGSNNGELTIDDVQLRRVDAPGVVGGESLETYSVARIPFPSVTIAAAVNSKRVEDQSEFMMGLERQFNAELAAYLRDTVGARQLFTGAGHYWASGFQEALIQGASDFTMSAKNWDYVSSDGTQWEVRNTSPLRRGPYDDGGTVTALALGAHRRQPFIASFAHPYPNRYQAESMLWMPAYSSLQDWDGLVLDLYADDVLSSKAHIDSAMFGPIAKNPLITSLMPAASHMFRNRLLAPAQGTIARQHSELEARIFPRMYYFWYDYGVPGGFSGRVMLANKLVIDSVDAQYFTQYEDISFPQEVEGQAQSDTRQILWEYSRGAFMLDAPKVQAATGYLSRSGAITLRNLDIKLLSGNETATLMWTSIDTTRLGERGLSLLTVASRTEPTGWNWIDTMHANRWGNGPMVLDPVRARLTMKVADDVNIATVRPLDSTGMPIGAPITATGSNGRIEITVDQTSPASMLYSVELGFDPAAGVENVLETAGLVAQPSIVTDRTYISFTSPGLSEARLAVFDALGRPVLLLHDGPIEAGRQTFRFDAAGLPSGVYIVRMQSGEASAVTRVTVTR